MFDDEDPSTRFEVAKKPYKSPLPATSPDGPKPQTAQQLDGPEMVALWKRNLAHFTTELDRQAGNREQMAKDADFYDNDQWSEADKKTLLDRGQQPLVYNVISASVDWVLGTEKRTRRDFKVLPRRKEEAKPAERKTQLLKYLSDVNKSPYHVSRAFEDAVKVGIGWMESGIQDEGEEEPLYSRYESWRNVLWDSFSTDMSIDDARYLYRTKWVDLDVAIAMFPHRKELLEQAALDSTDFIALDELGDQAMDTREMAFEDATHQRGQDQFSGFERKRVRLIEGWFRKPTMVDVVAGGPFRGEIYDPYSPGHQDPINAGTAYTMKKLRQRMHVCIMSTNGMLFCGESPYRHNKYPLTPIWGNRRDRDGMPYGMIRRLRDIQDDVNKRASKALHILSTNKTIMEKGAVDNIDEYLEEVSRPDAVLVVNAGKKLELNVDRDLSQWHLELMSRSISMIQQASGVTDELMGRGTNAKSGVAIQRRQEQGSMATARLFDNLAYASQCHGEKELSLVEQFMSEEKQFRITNMRKAPEYIDVNDGLPENDIVRTKADYIISEEDFHATLRQAAAEQLLEAMGTLPPEVAIVLIDLIVENMDLPNREEIVRRIRSVTGQRDPDAEEPTPEEQAKMAAANEAQKLQLDTLRAQLEKLVAEGKKANATAEKTLADLAKTNVDSTNAALTAAQLALNDPQAAQAADLIMEESGFVSTSTRKDQTLALAAAAQQQQRQLTPPQANGDAPAPQPAGIGIQPPA